MNEALQPTKGKDKVKEKMASKYYTRFGGKYTQGVRYVLEAKVDGDMTCDFYI